MTNDVINRFQFRPVMKIFLKARRNKILLSILCGVIIVLFITALFLIWFSYKQIIFNNYLENNYLDWRQDQQSSAYCSEYMELDNSRNNRFLETYITDGFNEIKATFDEFIPGVITKNYTALLSIETYHLNTTSKINQHYALNAFDEKTHSAIASALIAGQMPTSVNELLYYPANPSTPTYTINNTLTMAVTTRNGSLTQEFVIVGIIGKLDESLQQSGFSTDILNWAEYVFDDPTLHSFTYLFSPKEIFFTTPFLVSSLLNNYPEFETGIALVYDFIYDCSALNIQTITEIISQHQKLTRAMWFDFNFNFYLKPESPFIVCLDLFYYLISFQSFWIEETVRLSALAIPLVLLIAFIAIELFSLDSSELKNILHLLELNGLDARTIKRILIADSCIFASTSLLLGLFLGIVIGYLSLFFMKTGIELGYYLSGINERTFLITMLFCWFMFFIGRTIVSNNILKTISLFQSEHLISKRREIVQKISSIPELMLSLLGSVFLVIGVAGLIMTETFPHWIWNYAYIDYQLSLFIFWILIYIGGIALTICFFLLFARFTIWFWSFFGKRIWQEIKSYITLPMKTLSHECKNYRRTIVVILLLGLGLVPGIVLNKSIEEHYPFEANLAVGCSDLIIENWYFNQSLEEQLVAVENIEEVAELKQFELNHRDSLSVDAKKYQVTLLAIENLTAFNKVIDFSQLKDAGFTKEDISSLNKNMAYLIDEQHAKKYGYNKGVILYNTNISGTTSELALEYIGSYKYFPTLSLPETLPFQKRQIAFNLVTSLTTADKIVATANNTDINERGLLLIKATERKQAASIKEQLNEQFNITALTSNDFEELLKGYSEDFTINFVKVSTFLTIAFAITFYSLTAQRIYQRRKRIIEAEFHLGATRKQIWGGMTLELIVLIVTPMSLSIILSPLFLRVLAGIMINAHPAYKPFAPWFPVWLAILLIILGLSTIIFGWSIGIIPSVKNYRPIKEE